MLACCHHSEGPACMGRLADHYVVLNMHQIDPFTVVCHPCCENGQVEKQNDNSLWYVISSSSPPEPGNNRILYQGQELILPEKSGGEVPRIWKRLNR